VSLKGEYSGLLKVIKNKEINVRRMSRDVERRILNWYYIKIMCSKCRETN
jgi:hypothetical protein